MAFSNKVGNVLRQGAARSTQAPVASMLNYIRCMSSSKLFIGGIDICCNDCDGYKQRMLMLILCFFWFGVLII